MKFSRLALPACISAPLFLALALPADDLSFHPAANTEVAKTLKLDLEMNVSVNGEQVGADRSGHMGWSFEQLVSHASRASWVKAGEVLASGTCASGSLAESWGRTGSLTPPPLQPGDVVEMTIEHIGTIRNRVVETGDTAPAVPAARRRVRESV